MVKVFFYKAIDVLRPLTNDPFCPISSSDSNYNPRNTYCITVVKIFVFTRSKSGIFDLILHKIDHFSKVSNREVTCEKSENQMSPSSCSNYLFLSRKRK